MPRSARPAFSEHTQARHAAPRRRAVVTALVIMCAVLAVVLVVSIALATAAESGGAGAGGTGSGGTAPIADSARAPAPPPAASALPVPQRSDKLQAAPTLCELPEVQAALAAGEDSSVIAAAGGGEGFRQVVMSGQAPCIDLQDPRHVWFVVNKTMPMKPIDFTPYDWVAPAGMPLGNLAAARTDIAPTLTAMSDASVAAGAGRIGVQNGFRGYSVQQRIHAQKVAQLGRDEGERLAARPGYSEHQSGIAVDVFGCTPGCSSSEAFGGTSTYTWVVEHGWEYGWIVRYEEGQTAITGYRPEAWHLRYIGPELGRAYHEGGFHTLEEFFGLPAAPGYLD